MTVLLPNLCNSQSVGNVFVIPVVGLASLVLVSVMPSVVSVMSVASFVIPAAVFVIPVVSVITFHV